MAAFQVVVCALALFAFVQVSSACYGNGYPGYYGYGYGGDCCCCEPVTEVTTVACVPVVETFIEPGCGGLYGYGGGYGGYGYGYPRGGYGYGYPGGYYGYGY